MTPTARTLLLSEHPLRRWRADYERGLRSTALPYGIEALEERGYELEGVGRATSRVATKLRDVVEHRLGYPVERQVRAIPQAGRSDLVIALLESQGRLPAVLRARGIPPYSRRPLVVWTVWLGEQLRTLGRSERNALVRRYDGADLIVYLSGSQRHLYLDAGVSEDRLFQMTWGVAADYYTPDDTPRDLDVVAIGQDRGRDYATLFTAVRGANYRVDVICKPENLAGLDIPHNVTVHGTVGHEQYRSFLRRAKVLAVPTQDLAYPTGSSVALEASSCGTCVAATGTRAMREYLSDDVNAALVPLGDAEAWRTTLDALLADDARRARLGVAARESIVTRFNTRHMWHEIDGVLRARGIVNP